MGERGRGESEGKRAWIGRTVIVPIRDRSEVWKIYDINVPDAYLELTGRNTVKGFVGVTDAERDANRFSYNLDSIIEANPYYTVNNDGDPDETIIHNPPSRGGFTDQNGMFVPINEHRVFGGETRAQGFFSGCNSIQDIEGSINFLPEGKIVKQDKITGKEKVYDLKDSLALVKMCVANEAVVPKQSIVIMTNTEGFRDAVLRSIKLDFESNNSFGKCDNFDQIIKRIENVVAYNKIFSELPDFKIPQISLTNSGGQSLFDFPRHPQTGQVLSTEDGLGLHCLKYIKYWKEQGYTADQLKNTFQYQMTTSKYGLRNAVDRALVQ